MNFRMALTCTALLVSASASAQDCDRQCLIDLADDYVAALVDHDPTAVALAGDIRMVENLERIEPVRVSGRQPLRLRVLLSFMCRIRFRSRWAILP